MNNKYDDIIDVNYPFLLRHSRMSSESRASQFAPFAALSGYGEAINEEARITFDKLEFDDDTKEYINNRLQIIANNINNKYIICFKYFVYDKYKSGGKYVETLGKVKKIDKYRGVIILDNGLEIIISNIIDITSDSDIFNEYSDIL